MNDIYNGVHLSHSRQVAHVYYQLPYSISRWRTAIIFIKKKLTQLFTHLFFLLNIQKQHTESIIQNVKKRGIYSIENNYGAFNKGTLIRFLRNILHLKENINFFHNFHNFFLSLKYNYTIMCNYLNTYINLNDAHYIRYTSLWNLYKKCIPYLSGIF